MHDERPWLDERAPVRVGISSCLLGEEVRFDGGHKRDLFLLESLGRFVDWVPLCPEVDAGLSIPRSALRLVRDASPDEVRVEESRSGVDRTSLLDRAARKQVSWTGKQGLSGFVLKRDSPSCGLERVKVYRQGMPSRRDGRGRFAAELVRRFPDLPIEEEGRLRDANLRENFVERVFAYQRLETFFSSRWTPGAIVAFHTAHKLQLMAHSPQTYRSLGRLVAAIRDTPRSEFRARYMSEFSAGMRKLATRGRVTNVLQHMAGYFRRSLDEDSRRELAGLIEDYREGLAPIVVPLTLIRHHARALKVDYLLGQVYLEPHPKELMLRNHV